MKLLTERDVKNAFYELNKTYSVVSIKQIKEYLTNKNIIAIYSEVAHYMKELAKQLKLKYTSVKGYSGYANTENLKAQIENQDIKIDFKPVGIPLKQTKNNSSNDIDKFIMSDDEVVFHIEEDGSFGSIKFKNLNTSKNIVSIEIKIKNIGTPKASAFYKFDYK